MSDKQKHICETCRWWTSHAYKDEYSLGLCRVSPGAIEVDKDEWCSQWQAKPADASQAEDASEPQDFGEPEAGDVVKVSNVPKMRFEVLGVHGCSLWLVQLDAPRIDVCFLKDCCTVIERPPLKPGDIVEHAEYPRWGYGKVYGEQDGTREARGVQFGGAIGPRGCFRDALRRVLCAKESQE